MLQYSPAGQGQISERRQRLLIGNCPRQPDRRGFVADASGDYELAIVEFDDQGCYYERAQMAALADQVARLVRQDTDAVIVVFVHGWNHNADPLDAGLLGFRHVLSIAARHERQLNPARPRSILGIFVGWRGRTLFHPVLEYLTFWGRQAAGRRVAGGSVRELFGLLRRYRDARRAAGGCPLLAVIGHSFGGMIVYSVLDQSLIEYASSPDPQDSPRFADLVLLINPVLEATRYLPIYDILRRPGAPLYGHDTPPVFVCVSARNDWPDRILFPLGHAAARMMQRCRSRLERRCLGRTIGNIRPFRTHRLRGPVDGEMFSLTPTGNANRPGTPFWIVRAGSHVVDGHDGISREPFQEFVGSLLFQHQGRTSHGTGPHSAA